MTSGVFQLDLWGVLIIMIWSNSGLRSVALLIMTSYFIAFHWHECEYTPACRRKFMEKSFWQTNSILLIYSCIQYITFNLRKIPKFEKKKNQILVHTDLRVRY